MKYSFLFVIGFMLMTTPLHDTRASPIFSSGSSIANDPPASAALPTLSIDSELTKAGEAFVTGDYENVLVHTDNIRAIIAQTHGMIPKVLPELERITEASLLSRMIDDADNAYQSGDPQDSAALLDQAIKLAEALKIKLPPKASKLAKQITSGILSLVYIMRPIPLPNLSHI